jgi:hypothetical protein
LARQSGDYLANFSGTAGKEKKMDTLMAGKAIITIKHC